MKRISSPRVSFVGALALAALAASSVHAGPTSGGRSYPYRAGAGSAGAYSSSPMAIFGSSAPLYNPEAVLYAYYAPPARSPGAGGEEESEAVAGKTAAADVAIAVPANAEVWFDGHKTSQSGAARAFTTPPLERGKTYSYDLRVRWIADGGLVVDLARTIRVQAGRQTVVGFTR